MHTVTIFFSRIYEDETNMDVSKLDDTIKQFNHILYSVKHTLFQVIAPSGTFMLQKMKPG